MYEWEAREGAKGLLEDPATRCTFSERVMNTSAVVRDDAFAVECVYYWTGSVAYRE